MHLPLLYYSILMRNSKFHRVFILETRGGRGGQLEGQRGRRGEIHFPRPWRFPAPGREYEEGLELPYFAKKGACGVIQFYKSLPPSYISNKTKIGFVPSGDDCSANYSQPGTPCLPRNFVVGGHFRKCTAARKSGQLLTWLDFIPPPPPFLPLLSFNFPGELNVKKMFV